MNTSWLILLVAAALLLVVVACDAAGNPLLDRTQMAAMAVGRPAVQTVLAEATSSGRWPTLPADVAPAAAARAQSTAVLVAAVTAPTSLATATPTTVPPVARVIGTAAPPAATATRPAAPAIPATAPPPNGAQPRVSHVSGRTPAEIVAYLRGSHPAYPGSGPAGTLNFSASNILETMDVEVVEQVRRQRGESALGQLYEVIARAILATLREQYPDRWVVLALDAGHGGKKGFYWDGGGGGKEADHVRAVAVAVSRLAERPEYARIIVRPIYNDELADDYRLPPDLSKPTHNRVLTRQIRASMLASEVAAWNQTHPEPADQALLHEVSIHFNAGSGGALVLHQGTTVRPEFTTRSIEFARRYLRHVIADLNATGLLPSPLRPWASTGLHDDVMMYQPGYLDDDEIRGETLRYGVLQSDTLQLRYIHTILNHWPGQ